MKWTIGNTSLTWARKISVAFLSSVLDREMFRFEFQRMWYLKSWWSRPSWSVLNSVSLICSNQPENVPSSRFNLFEQQMTRRQQTGPERKKDPSSHPSNEKCNILQNIDIISYWGRIMLAKIDILTSQHMACLRQLVFFLQRSFFMYVGFIMALLLAVISCQIFTNWIICRRALLLWWSGYRFTGRTSHTSHCTVALWEQCIFWSSTTGLCRPPVCHNKQDQQIRSERQRDGKYCPGLLWSVFHRLVFIRHLYTDLSWSVGEVKGATYREGYKIEKLLFLSRN